MATEAVLRGYLLEEALAWLLRSSGYRLLVSAEDDPELEAQGHEIRVKGRGTSHQVDVLGELAFTPAFSLPVRLFLEAKSYSKACRLPVVRNALGVIDDVNEHFVPRPGERHAQRRYQYAYALFSTSGFTRDAEEYALAHQISLVDMSGASFSWLREPVAIAAGKLRRRQERFSVETFPVTWMRSRLRALLATAPLSQLPAVETNAPLFTAEADQVLTKFAEVLVSHQQTQLLLGFPAAPFILSLATDNKQAFSAYAAKHPSHTVRITRSGQGPGAEWALCPLADQDAYRLTFSLPEHIESWIAANEEERLARTRQIKAALLSSITVYDSDADGEDYLVYRLRYAPGSLRRA
jgi:hypothetical protein